MQQRHEGGQELLAATQAVLNKQGSSWRAACTALGQLLTQLSQSRDRHAEGHAALKQGIKRALEVTKEVAAHFSFPSNAVCQSFWHFFFQSKVFFLCAWSALQAPCHATVMT